MKFMKNWTKKIISVWLLAAIALMGLLTGCSDTLGESVSSTQSKSEVIVDSTRSESEAIVDSTQSESEAIVNSTQSESEAVVNSAQEQTIQEDGSYTGKEEVAAYIHQYGRLPNNYITKKAAESMGWDSSKGNLWDVAPGKSIGGSHFGNYENSLPKAKGRSYQECDIDYEGKYRGAKRIIFSNDGLVFYTEDHYKTFEQLY